jgi:predicted TIM-barrel fold metal-dependent hydrolase
MRSLHAKGMTGFRIRPKKSGDESWLQESGMQQMWRCGAEDNLAMCPLIDPEFLPQIDQMCDKYPRTPVVIDHFGRIGIDGQIRETDLKALCRLARHRNVRVKISAYYALGKKAPPYHDLRPMILRVLDAFGPERLMWASDCPYQLTPPHTYAASLQLIQTGIPELSEGDRDWLLRKTAAATYFHA